MVEYDRLPQVIAGTSAGSLIASFVCTRTDEELKREIQPELHQLFTACDLGWWDILKNMYHQGAMFDPDRWREKLRSICHGDLTFLEAYERTGRILNITVVSDQEHSPAKLLNYKNSPDILVWSAVLASSAVPGILPPIELKRKTKEGRIVPYLDEGERWCDGSLRGIRFIK